MFIKNQMKQSIEKNWRKIERLQKEINQAEAVLIGAGAGLSVSAGYTYYGDRFQRYFHDFSEKYGIKDMYSGGFYPFETINEHWAYWSRFIYFNRYNLEPQKVYLDLLEMVKNKNYFVLTTNVDHQFQLNGFDKNRLFYTQGDYGLFQCATPCHQKTYGNEAVIRQMVLNQENMKISSELIPKCPICGKQMSMNLRSDDSFVEDNGWVTAANRYFEFVQTNKNTQILYLELGVGLNTPGIIKYPFWSLTAQNQKAIYASINLDKSKYPNEIESQSICINADIGYVLQALKI